MANSIVYRYRYYGLVLISRGDNIQSRVLLDSTLVAIVHDVGPSKNDA